MLVATYRIIYQQPIAESVSYFATVHSMKKEDDNQKENNLISIEWHWTEREKKV